MAAKKQIKVEVKEVIEEEKPAEAGLNAYSVLVAHAALEHVFNRFAH